MIAPDNAQWKKDLAWFDGEIARLGAPAHDAGKNCAALLPAFLQQSQFLQHPWPRSGYNGQPYCDSITLVNRGVRAAGDRT